MSLGSVIRDDLNITIFLIQLSNISISKYNSLCTSSEFFRTLSDTVSSAEKSFSGLKIINNNPRKSMLLIDLPRNGKPTNSDVPVQNFHHSITFLKHPNFPFYMQSNIYSPTLHKHTYLFYRTEAEEIRALCLPDVFLM